MACDPRTGLPVGASVRQGHDDLRSGMSAPYRIVDTPEWTTLGEHALGLGQVHLRELFAADGARGTSMIVEVGDLYVDYSKHRVTSDTIRMLAALARRAGVELLRDAMFAGKH